MDFSKIKNAVSDKSPEILIGLGLAGMLTSTVLAVKATPKALDILEQVKKLENQFGSIEKQNDSMKKEEDELEEFTM